MRRAVSAMSCSASDLPTLDALGVQERVGHAAADDQRIDLADQIFEQVELGRDLGAADDGDRPAASGFQRLLERLELGLHGAAGIGRQQWASPSVEACARCAAENASLT